MSNPKIVFSTLGMVILDDIYFKDDVHDPIYNLVGGSGTYSILGARLFCPGPKSGSIGWVMRIGIGFPSTTLDKLRTWGTNLHVIDEAAATTRGNLHYEDTTLGPKTFRYNSMPLWILPEHFSNTQALLSRTFHFFGPPSNIFRDVPKLLALRANEAGITDRPRVIWEPSPPTCTPKFLGASMNAMKFVDVFSPNHMEMLGFFGLEAKEEDGFDRTLYEGLAKKFIEKGIGEDKRGYIILRAGEHGCMIFNRGMEGPKWIPPYYGNGHEKVVDSTGAGNSFLGGFAVGFGETADAVEAAMYGAVAASFVIEQVGVPELIVEEEGNERWNGEDVRGRLAAYKANLLNLQQ